MARVLCSNRACQLRARCLRYLEYPDDTAQRYENYAALPRIPTGECAGWVSTTGLDPRSFRGVAATDLLHWRMETAEVVS